MNSTWLVIFLGALQAQDTIGVEAKAKSAEILLAEPVHVQYHIRSNANLKLDLSAWKPTSTQWGDFTLWDFRQSENKEKDKKTITLDITLMAFKLGKAEIPSLEIPAQAGLGQTMTIKTPPVPIQILDPTENAPNPTQIRDIKKPVKPLYFWEQPWAMAGMGLLGAFALFALYFFWKQRRQAPQLQNGQPQRLLTPEEAFNAALEQLLASDLSAPRRLREFHFSLSEIFRAYLDRRFNLDTQSLPSNELWRLLHQQRQEIGVDLPILIRLKESFEISDLAKFAKLTPAEEENNTAIQILKNFVESHRPTPITPEPPR